MQRVNYGKMVDLSRKLDGKTDIYAVDSLLHSNLKYIIRADEFIVAYDDGEMRHRLEDIKHEAEMYVPKVKAEILAIYDDIKDLMRMGVAI
ncbi:hypothetical protein M2140_001942 [Clostridiales Family XIII bacterium PM5-7]